jgi:hypothetical protein
LLVWGVPGRSHATVVRAVALRDLVGMSRHVVIGDALEAYGVWETVARRRRIVTYTRLRVTEQVHGSAAPEREVQVRTLGGRVGEIGQIVHGEAVIPVGLPSLLFLRQREDGALGVAAMAQGHFPLDRDASTGALRLTRSPRLGEMLGADGSAAVRQLVGRSLEEAKRLVKEAARR